MDVMKSMVSRRNAFKAAMSVAGPAALGQTAAPPRRVRFACSTYSYWHFKGERFPCEKVIEEAAKLGFDGVEILHRQMTSHDAAYANKLKMLAFQHGLALPMLSIHQDFVEPDAAERRKNVEHTIGCIELANRMGIAAIRLNSGRWNTIRSFDELMKVKGIEPPIEGYKDEDAMKWCVDSIHDCLPAAEKHGVLLALENHWGLTTSVDTLLAIHKRVASPWLGINLDTGNFPGDPYAGIEQLAPHANIVQAKTYYGGGVWYTLDLDYKRIARILNNAGFRGWVSLEMEGNESPSTAVPKSLAVLREAWGSAG